MEITDLHELVKQSVECSICLDTLESPVSLNCLHTFCLKHVPNLSTKHHHQYVIHCPLCRTNTVVKSFNMLKKNILAQSIAEAVASVKTSQQHSSRNLSADFDAKLSLDESCAICTNRKAEVYCFLCEQSFCSLCDGKVHRSIALRQHNRVPVAKKNIPLPVVMSVYPNEGPISGNTMLTIHGTHFGASIENIVVSIGGNICQNISLSANPNHCEERFALLKCLTPKGYGRDQRITVSVNGVTAADQHYFSYYYDLAPLSIARYGLGCVAVDRKLYAIGGCIPGSYYNTVEEYNPATNTWTLKADIPTRSARTRFGCATIKKNIYMIGGYEQPIIEVFNTELNEWSTIESTFTKRFSPSCVTIDDRLFLVGGSDTHSLEEYIVDQNRWVRRANMPTNRRLMGCTAVNGKIYAIGGFDGKTRYSVVEEYDPIADRWYARSGMPTHRDGLSVAVVGNKIYAMGGWNGSSGWLDRVERYDPITDKWSVVAPMTSKRNVFGCAAIGDRIYAVGGHDGTSELASVEQYLSIFNVWTTQTKYAAESDEAKYHHRSTAAAAAATASANTASGRIL